MRFLYYLMLTTLFISSCKNKQESYISIQKKSPVHQVLVNEVIQGNTYTFLFVNENNVEYWMAVSKTDVKANETVYYKNALKMNDFKSKELNRVFEEIYFVQNISHSPQLVNSKPKSSQHQHENKKEDITEVIKVDPAPDGMTIGELFKNGKKYSNKKVIIRGQVVKVNKSIMDRNWVHLKDGTNDAGKSDLTFTTLAEVEVGDVITFEGTVAIDKEYGAGYVYPLIVEDALIK